MKIKYILNLWLIIITCGVLQAQNETMYIYKDGLVIGQYNLENIDSIIFYKKGEVPTIETSIVSNITQSSALAGGKVNNDGGLPVTELGVCWSTSIEPTINDNLTTDNNELEEFISTLTDLVPNTFYYIRAYATNSIGTAYGNSLIFKTYTNIVDDSDGNSYYTVTIGDQEWMAEDIKTTKYNDGSNIPKVTDDSEWGSLSSDAYSWYNNDSITYAQTYGPLYNFYVVESDKLCPIGWHVPTDDEWTILTDYVGGESIAGGKLKEAGTTNWESPNNQATNEYSFSARPGGYRYYDGSFVLLKQSGYWWCSDYTYRRYMSFSSGSLSRYSGSSKKVGFSVRCIKN